MTNPLQFWSYDVDALPKGGPVEPPPAPEGQLWVPQQAHVAGNRLVVLWALASPQDNGGRIQQVHGAAVRRP